MRCSTVWLSSINIFTNPSVVSHREMNKMISAPRSDSVFSTKSPVPIIYILTRIYIYVYIYNASRQSQCGDLSMTLVMRAHYLWFGCLWLFCTDYWMSLWLKLPQMVDGGVQKDEQECDTIYTCVMYRFNAFDKNTIRISSNTYFAMVFTRTTRERYVFGYTDESRNIENDTTLQWHSLAKCKTIRFYLSHEYTTQDLPSSNLFLVRL